MLSMKNEECIVDLLSIFLLVRRERIYLQCNSHAEREREGLVFNRYRPVRNEMRKRTRRVDRHCRYWTLICAPRDWMDRTSPG